MAKVAAQKITPFLWFDKEAEEAVNLYVSIFKNAKINGLSRYTKSGPGPAGSVMTISFRLDGCEFVALNGGPHYKITPGVSFVVNCETQEEVDHFWEALSEGGKKQQCGWLQDKFGVSWQIVPTLIGELMTSGDARRQGNLMKAIFQMTKPDIAAMKEAYEG